VGDSSSPGAMGRAVLAIDEARGKMPDVPRSRWFALVVAALLCVLGGANRGRVPAHEREGSRTADEPALTSGRSLLDVVRRGAVRRPSVGDDGVRPAPRDVIVVVGCVVERAVVDRGVVVDEQRGGTSASPRGPPQPGAALV